MTFKTHSGRWKKRNEVVIQGIQRSMKVVERSRSQEGRAVMAKLEKESGRRGRRGLW